MYKTIVTISLSLFTLLNYTAAAKKVRFEKSVIDTVYAMHNLTSSIDLYNSYTLEQIEKLKKTPGNEAKIEDYKNDLFETPKHFSEYEWRKVMKDSDIPVKEIIIERNAEGLDRYSFTELLDLLYPEESDKMMYDEELSVVGKFDGLIKDRIGIFPADLTISKSSSPHRNKEYFDKILIKSMWETTPPLIIPLQFKVSDQEIRAQLCNAHWDDSGLKRDGVEIRVLRPNSSDGIRIFAYYDGKKWKQTLPKNGECLSYDECYSRMEAAGKEPVILQGSYREDRAKLLPGQQPSLPFSFLVTSDGELDNWYSSARPILKYKIKKNGKMVTGNCFLEELDYRYIFVESDYRGTGNDVIVVEYIKDKEGFRNIRRNVYKPVMDKSNTIEGPVIRDANIDSSIYLVKIGEGVLNYDDNKWYMMDVDQE